MHGSVPLGVDSAMRTARSFLTTSGVGIPKESASIITARLDRPYPGPVSGEYEPP